MYSTHAPHPKAFATATGARAPFLYEKEKFQDPKPPALPRHKGKQFLTAPPKKPIGGSVGFFHPLKHPTGEKFVDTTGYVKTQPLDQRKKGFGSRDCKRRDEYTMHVQTERYREQLNAETKIMRKHQPVVPEAPKEDVLTARTADPVLSRIPKHQYSFFREAITPDCPKCHRDTFFCPHKAAAASQTRRVSLGVLTSHEFGAAVEEVRKPEFGRVCTTKQFSDIGHLGEL